MTRLRTFLANKWCWLGPSVAAAIGIALVAAWQSPAWMFMWVLAFAIFAGFKWLTYCEALVGGLAAPKLTRCLYLFCWPGMSLTEFAKATASTERAKSIPRWTAAAAKTLIGAGLVWLAVPTIPPDAWLPRGWVGMVGIIMMLHFGIFLERLPLFRRRPWLKRLFAWGILVAPLGCLFPPVFVRSDILPMLHAVGATGKMP